MNSKKIFDAQSYKCPRPHEVAQLMDAAAYRVGKPLAQRATQKQMAKILGVSMVTYQRWRRGTTHMPYWAWFALNYMADYEEY